MDKMNYWLIFEYEESAGETHCLGFKDISDLIEWEDNAFGIKKIAICKPI